MAGDWIKVEQATLDKPEILRAADMLGVHRREALGIFIEFWIWLDKNLSGSCPDFVRNTSRKSLDELLHVHGFAAVLEHIGWATWDDERVILHVTNADRHNGNTAKTRALDAKRKRNSRRSSVPEVSVSQPDVSGTREEKRRDITPIVPVGFVAFWSTYPTSRRVGKGKCLKVWQSANLEALSDRIVAHVESMKRTPQWTKDGGQFAPTAITYLNQRRFEDGEPEAQNDRLRVAM